MKIVRHTYVESVNDYYPFGLVFNSYHRESSIPQNYLFSGKERQNELSLGWDDFGARMYMNDIGKWGVIDPLSDSAIQWSPYTYAYNNPLRFIDPDGRYAIDKSATREERKAIRQAMREARRLARDKDVRSAMKTYGQLSKREIMKDLRHNGKGPVIKPAALSSAYGEFTPGKGAKEIRLDKALLKKQDKAKGEEKKDYQFLTAVTALHEDTHRGDNKDGVDYPGEEGELMEAAAFGAVVDETNMKTVRKTIKKKKP